MATSFCRCFVAQIWDCFIEYFFIERILIRLGMILGQLQLNTNVFIDFWEIMTINYVFSVVFLDFRYKALLYFTIEWFFFYLLFLRVLCFLCSLSIWKIELFFLFYFALNSVTFRILREVKRRVRTISSSHFLERKASKFGFLSLLHKLWNFEIILNKLLLGIVGIFCLTKRVFLFIFLSTITALRSLWLIIMVCFLVVFDWLDVNYIF